jgi:hypothetical protein
VEQQHHGGGGHVAKLGESLRDAAFRNSFADNHAQALKDAGIDEAALPDGIIDALGNCQPEELAAVAKVRGALMDAGVSREDAGRIV